MKIQDGSIEVRMQADILALLNLFKGRVPDPETHAWVTDLASNRNRWRKGHEVFDRVRDRNLSAINQRDRARECQYCFEEVCLKSLYNETDALDPFDSDSPYWIIKNAVALARAIGVPDEEVVAVFAPRVRPV
jgi:hypothetical protein